MTVVLIVAAGVAVYLIVVLGVAACIRHASSPVVWVPVTRPLDRVSPN